MTLQQLEYIVALDEERHFVRAAERCFVTQPTLSMQVRKLEESLDILIFDRKAQPLRPTPLGEKVIARARRIVQEARQLKAMIAAESGEMAGEFRIGIIPTIAPYVLPRFLKRFLAKYPDIQLVVEELQTEKIIALLEDGKLDAGLMAGPLDNPHLRSHTIFWEPFLLYADRFHPLATAPELDPAALDPHEMWILNEGHCFREQVLNICQTQAARGEQRLRYQSGSIETLKRMVRESGGYTLVPELALDAGRPPEKIVVRRFPPPEPVREVSLFTHHSYAKTFFVEKLRDEIIDLIPDNLRKAEGRKRIRIY